MQHAEKSKRFNQKYFGNKQHLQQAFLLVGVPRLHNVLTNLKPRSVSAPTHRWEGKQVHQHYITKRSIALLPRKWLASRRQSLAQSKPRIYIAICRDSTTAVPQQTSRCGKSTPRVQSFQTAALNWNVNSSHAHFPTVSCTLLQRAGVLCEA